MCERIEDLIEGFERFTADLDRSTPSAARAVELVSLLGRAEKLITAARTLAAARVQRTRAWHGSGFRNMAEWIAARTGSTLGQAVAEVQTAAVISELPATRAALVAGELSTAQAAAIASASVVDPSSEDALLELAGREGVAALREKCRQVKAAAAGDEDATERIRRSRYLRHWISHDGALRLDARLAPDDGAPLLAAIRLRGDALQNEARQAEQFESAEAHAADALCSLADGDGAPKAIVNVVVSKTAWDRGRTVAGETCAIDGVAPISVSSAKRLAAGGKVLHAQFDGADVRTVSRGDRMIPAAVRRALLIRDPMCVVPGCSRRRGLEIDHVVPFHHGGETKLDNLARLCRWHHAQKTHHGWRLEGTPGSWIWTKGKRASRGP